MFNQFIQRPVLAIAISLGIVFLGLLAIYTLPVAQFPEIAPPRVTIFIEFPGSNADLLVKSTLTILEREINGVQGMQYMLSDATSASEASIDIVFEPGTDPTIAAARVKTRVDQVMTNLPPLVQREGVIIKPLQPSMLMYLNLLAPIRAMMKNSYSITPIPIFCLNCNESVVWVWPRPLVAGLLQ